MEIKNEILLSLIVASFIRRTPPGPQSRLSVVVSVPRTVGGRARPLLLLVGLGEVPLGVGGERGRKDATPDGRGPSRRELSLRQGKPMMKTNIVLRSEGRHLRLRKGIGW